MEIMPGVDQVVVDYKGRPLKLYFLRGQGAGSLKMLMDVGDDATVEGWVLPWFERIGMKLSDLTHVMLTHPDLDHTGGVQRMKRVVGASGGNAKFVCGQADREQVETPEGLADIRARAHFYWHGLGVDGEARENFIKRAGGPGGRVVMDQTYVGGERLLLERGKRVEVLHLPGHSEGHLGVYVPSENAAIIGDAVHGTANRFMDGRAAFAPTYMYVDAYLGTIKKLLAMKLDRLYSCHWPDCGTAVEVERFLQESKAYCEKAEVIIAAVVEAAGEKGLTLREVCERAKTGLGDWPAEKDTETRSMACGHLQRLAGLGRVRLEAGERPVRYVWERQWRGLR